MFEQKLNELKSLLEQFPKTVWLSHDKRIDDDTQKWVIYQAGFDVVSDLRLDLIAKTINLLPELISAAETALSASSNEELSLPKIKTMISEAIVEHEKKKH